MTSKFNMNEEHLIRLFGKHSESFNFGYNENHKIHLSIKGKRKVKLIAKIWLMGERGFKWFSIQLNEFKNTPTGLNALLLFLRQLNDNDTYQLLQQNGK